MQSVLTLSLSQGADAIAQAAEEIEAVCDRQGIPPRVAFELNLAIDELVTNTLSYGFSGESATPEVSLQVYADSEWIEVVLTDNGRPYDPFTEAPPPVLEGSVEERPIGGLGVYFVEKMMTTVGYRRDGNHNVIILRRRFAGETAAD